MRYGVFLVASFLAAAQTPAGWKAVKSSKPLVDAGKPAGKGEQCQIAVPGDWLAGNLSLPGRTAVKSPDGKLSATVREYGPDRSFADAKKELIRSQNPTKVFEDSSTRFFYRSQSSNSLYTVWEVVTAGNPACTAQITFHDASVEETARKIALSLTSAK